MDELDHMYDDMQDRLYEIDKNRKVQYRETALYIIDITTYKNKLIFLYPDKHVNPNHISSPNNIKQYRLVILKI
jgi:hypothetical protein